MKVNEAVKWESTNTAGRWFTGRIRLLFQDLQTALVEDDKGFFWQEVKLDRLKPV